MLVRGEERHQDVTTTKRNCYSIISNENTNIFGQGIMTTYGYNYLDVDRVLHIFEEDSYSSDLNEKPIISCLKVNRIMTPKELSNGCSWYSEIQIVNKKFDSDLCRAKKPDYIVAIDYINSKDVSESKRLNIPIVLIKKQSLEQDKMVDISLKPEEDEYIDKEYQEFSHGKIYRLK